MPVVVHNLSISRIGCTASIFVVIYITIVETQKQVTIAVIIKIKHKGFHVLGNTDAVEWMTRWFDAPDKLCNCCGSNVFKKVQPRRSKCSFAEDDITVSVAVDVVDGDRGFLISLPYPRHCDQLGLGDCHSINDQIRRQIKHLVGVGGCHLNIGLGASRARRSQYSGSSVARLGDCDPFCFAVRS